MNVGDMLASGILFFTIFKEQLADLKKEISEVCLKFLGLAKKLSLYKMENKELSLMIMIPLS